MTTWQCEDIQTAWSDHFLDFNNEIVVEIIGKSDTE